MYTVNGAKGVFLVLFQGLENTLSLGGMSGDKNVNMCKKAKTVPSKFKKKKAAGRSKHTVDRMTLGRHHGVHISKYVRDTLSAYVH
jgi:hypothetical protein